MTEKVSLEVAIEVVLRNGPNFEMIAGLCKMSVEAEREACAKVCEAGVDYEHPTVKGHIMENFGHSRLLAKAIRARGNT